MDIRQRKRLLDCVIHGIVTQKNGEVKIEPGAESATESARIQERIRIELGKCANSMKMISSYEMVQFDETMLNALDNQLLCIMQSVANARFELLQLYTLNERVHDGDRNENV